MLIYETKQFEMLEMKELTFLKYWFLNVMYMGAFSAIYACVPLVYNAHGDQKRVLDHLELELQMVVI